MSDEMSIDYLNNGYVNKFFQHYKGGIYKFLMLGKLESIGELQVVYQSLDTLVVYIRPEKEFFEKFKEMIKREINND